MSNFAATTVACYEEDDVLVVALGNDSVDPSRFVVISRLDDEDNATVDDGIGLQTADSEYEMTGAIQRISLLPGSLEVEVKPEFHNHFGESCIVAEMTGDASSLPVQARLRQALKVIFKGSSVELIL